MFVVVECGKICINELCDDFVGELWIVIMLELGVNYVIFVLLYWMFVYCGLFIYIEVDNYYVDLMNGWIDIVLRMSLMVDD